MVWFANCICCEAIKGKRKINTVERRLIFVENIVNRKLFERKCATMKKGIIQLLIANMIYLLISILNSFLLPKFLSVDTYAVIKTYTLYIGYAGFLSLGYADGMYLKYGGNNIERIEKEEFGSNLKSYVVLEIVISTVGLIIAVVIKDFVIMAFAFGSLFVNVIGYYKNLYQAVGEYKLYGKALNYQTILLFFLNIVLMFALKLDNAGYYIFIQVFTAFLVMIYLTVILNKRTSLLHSGKTSLKYIRDNVSSGFVLMLGNFSSSIFTSLDRWFVKFSLNDISFAQYSFAVSLENIINVFVTPITISLYNMFCINRTTEYVRKMKKLVLLWGCVIIAAAFPVKFVVTLFLPNYVDALDIIFPLFGAQAFYAVIKGIHVNIYKAEKKQKRYFFIMFAMIGVAIATNIIFYMLFHSVWSFALATFVTAAIWLMYCEFETKALRFTIKEYSMMICILTGYFFAASLKSAIIGLGVYCIVLFISSVIFMRGTVKDACSIVISYFAKKRG